MFKFIDKYLELEDSKQYLRKDYFNYLVLTFALILGMYLNWSLKDIAGLLFFVYVILWLPSSKKIASLALYSLILVPIMLVLRRETRAENFAEVVYFLLCFTLVLALWETKYEK